MLLMLLGLFVLLLLAGAPIFLSLTVPSLMYAFGELPGTAVPHMMFGSINSFVLSAVPFFILMGNVLMASGVSKRLIEAINALVGHIPGGLTLVTVLSCAVFAAINGSSTATAAAIGTVLIPEMTHLGYDRKFACGLVAAAGTLGILIPPSIPLILFAGITEQSINDLFMAGVIPGLVLTAMLSGVAVWIARRRGYGAGERVPHRVAREKILSALPVILLPVVVVGSMYTGIASPSESAAVGAFGAILLGWLVYRELTWAKLWDAVKQTVQQTTMIFFIIMVAILFGTLLTYSTIPQHLTTAAVEGLHSPLLFLLIVNLILILMGDFLEAVSILYLAVPMLFPIAMKLGIDPLHFGILFVVNMEFGMITPPVGLNLFVISGISKTRVEEVLRGTLPFMVVIGVFLLMLMAIPDFFLILVR